MIDKQFSLYNGGRCLILSVLMLLSSCSITTESIPSDLLFINSWREQRVDFNMPLTTGVVTSSFSNTNHPGRRVNPAVEPVKEFATAVGRDGALYFVYTTDVNSHQTVTYIPGSGVATNIFTSTLEGLSNTRSLTITTAFTRGTSGTTFTNVSTVTNEPSPENKTPETGVWVRVLRYDNTSSTPWSLVMATDRPAMFTGVKLVFIPGRTLPYVAAISNGNRLAIFGQSGGITPQVNFIQEPTGSLDLNNGRNPSVMSNISSFNDGDRTYISFIEDDRNIVGYIRSLKWLDNYASRWDGRTPEVFSMSSSQGEVYGVWWNSIDQISIVTAYATNTTASRRWLTVNNLSATELPKLKSRFYRSSEGANNVVYLGYIYGATKYFQLSTISNNQIYATGVPLDGYNNRYDFDIDSVGRVMYGRVSSTGSIDVATWTHSVWRTASQPEKIIPNSSGVNRISYKVYPSSSLETAFTGNDSPYVIFIEDSGYLNMIEGIKASG